MSDFKDLPSLFKHIEREAKKTIQQDDTNVKNVVVREIIESIEENVYDAYHSPAKNPYERRMSHGGLTDPDNFRVENTGDGVAISSSRQGIDGYGNQTDVLEIIEGNSSYSIQDVWGYGYEEPRSAIEPARDSLKSKGNLLNKAFKLDLQNRGFKVE